MSAPVRFLALLVIGWAGIRAATLGFVPGFTMSYAKPADANVPPVEPTQFPSLPPLAVSAEAPAFPEAELYSSPPVEQRRQSARRAPAPGHPQFASTYYSYGPPAPGPSLALRPRPQWQLTSAPAQGPDFYTPIAPVENWDVAQIASARFPERRSAPVPPVLAQGPAEPKLDRWQMSSWALLRGAPSPGALAAGGTLGGSQAGARVTYAFDRRIAASLRSTSPIGGSRGAEIAGGIRFTPLRSIPIAITAERRQSISPHGGGRSAFALFAEGGLYRRPMPLGFSLDAYVQAGIVGLKSRDYFADGAFAFSRPVYKNFSAGFGVWGGAQPGLYRIDAGPRISYRVRDNIHVHLDWRQRMIGNAEPASGPALTLAADF